MNNQIDSEKNTKIVYLYVKSFVWTTPMDKEQALGHPQPNKLYRAVYNTDTGTHRIIYDSTTNGISAIFLGKLKSDDAMYGYTSDISEIDLNNILDFDFKEDELDQLLGWIEKENKDLIDTMWGNPPTEIMRIKSNSLPEFLVNLLRNSDPEFADFVGLLKALREYNPSLFQSLNLLTANLVDFEEEGLPDTPITSDWISLDKNLGAGANLSAAIKRLSVYGGSDRKTNMSEEDLVGAIKDLLTELYRRILHEIK